VIASSWVDEIRATLPELPEARKARLVAQYGLSEYDADVIVRLSAGPYFEQLVFAGAPAKAAGNWLQGEVRRKLKETGDEDIARLPMGAPALAELIGLAETDVISSTAAKEVFEQMWTSGRGAREIVDAQGLAQTSDASALESVIASVLTAHADAAAQYRAGKTATFGFLVGQVMKATQGKANPKVASEMLRKALDVTIG
jgi:aspartyl-tRNA(Asn)/glutamyl-tRNA(Gln) amidotransferase subunit B